MTIHVSADAFDVVLLREFDGKSLPDRLRLVRAMVDGPLVFTTSFGIEDQVLTHAAVEAGIAVTFATLDTGRLFDETLELWAETELRFGIAIRSYMPAAEPLEELVRRDGPLGFRRSIAARQACCEIRKVEPLGRALAGAAGWLTGLRTDQSAARRETSFVSADAQRSLLKFSPLADWSREQVVGYAARHAVPTNVLHARGYPSIGCAPCTRPVQAGEDERAGRWWWENEDRKECGLHAGHLATATASATPGR